MSNPEKQAHADILVIDDERLLLEVVGDILRSAGHNVELASGGQEAIGKIDSHEYDVLVCDLVMPEVDGITVLAHARERSPDTEVIILTGQADIDSAVRCLRLGAFDIVRKELEMPELVPAVERAVERRRLRSASSLHQVSSLIFTSEDRTDLPERIVNVATQVMHADDASLMLMDVNGELYVAYSNGLPERLHLTERILVGEGIAGRIAEEREPVIIQGEPSSLERLARAEASQIRKVLSSIVYPLVSGERLLGVLNLNRVSAEKRPFRPADIARAELLASQIVLALENQQLIRRVTATDKFTAVGQLSTAIAHEINNPITYVLGGIDHVKAVVAKVEQALEDRSIDPSDDTVLSLLGGREGIREIRESLDDSHDGAIRIRDVVRDLRSMVRAEQGEKEAFDLNASIQAALRISMAELRSIADLDTKFGTDVIVGGSRGAMSQVFVNLFINAAHAMRDSEQKTGKLTIESVREGSRVEVTVTDTGPGIPPDLLARIFEPFFTTKPIGVGTGLGLPTCRDIVAWHGGLMRVRSTVGKGTTFRISLPALKTSAGWSAEGESGRLTMESPAPVEPLRILVIDDEHAICRTLIRILRGHEVTAVHNGREALQLLRNRRDFDLVLCDVVLPELSGVDLYTLLDKEDIPVLDRFVFITGSVGFADVRQFANSHSVRVLEKPLDNATLLALVRSFSKPA